MRSVREALHQIDLLVLLAEPTTYTLGPFFDEHLGVMSVALGLTVHELVALSTVVDEVLLFYLGPALREHWARQKEQRQLEKVERVSSASQQLVERVRWSGDQAELDVQLLLGPLLDGTQKYLLFVSPAFEVGISRSKLKEVAKVLGKRADLIAFVDPKGLHFRWHQGRGRLNFHPQPGVRFDKEDAREPNLRWNQRKFQVPNHPLSQAMPGDEAARDSNFRWFQRKFRVGSDLGTLATQSSATLVIRLLGAPPQPQPSTMAAE